LNPKEFIDSLFSTYGGSGLWIIISGFILAEAMKVDCGSHSVDGSALLEVFGFSPVLRGVRCNNGCYVCFLCISVE